MSLIGQKILVLFLINTAYIVLKRNNDVEIRG